ncbi:MAG: histidine phosphatase family protein [Bacteroidota bacterium]
MKTLVLVRHAKSDWSYDLPDFDRPLNKRGLRDAPRMGKLLREYDFQPDIMLTSSANRARTTAHLVARELGFGGAIQEERSIYDEGHGNLIGLVQEFPQAAETAMVFGHNPTMEYAVAYLLQMRAAVTMPTCAMACLESPVNDWSRLSPALMRLKWLLIPRLIR